VNMLRKMPQYSTLGGQHPPECQSNPARQGTFTTQKHSGTEGSACSGISINLKSIGAVINSYINNDFWIEKIPDRQKRIDTATYSILHITRHWFDYKLPKWLNVISNLQEY